MWLFSLFNSRSLGLSPWKNRDDWFSHVELTSRIALHLFFFRLYIFSAWQPKIGRWTESWKLCRIFSGPFVILCGASKNFWNQTKLIMLSSFIIHKPRNLQNTEKKQQHPHKNDFEKTRTKIKPRPQHPTSRNTRYTHQPHFYTLNKAVPPNMNGA